MYSIRRWWRTWGATGDELAGAMLGDEAVTQPGYEATLGVTIDAPASDIWPWIVQMGYERGGLYSYDWLDRLFGYLNGPSAEEILPRWQHLAPGDVIPIGRAGGFPVRSVVPYRSLVLAGHEGDIQWSWEIAIAPYGSASRLISRNRVQTGASLRARGLLRIIEPAAFVMTRRMLLGIKRRAEAQRRVARRAA